MEDAVDLISLVYVRLLKKTGASILGGAHLILGGALVSPYGSPSITREIRSEFSFYFHEKYTFGDFLIDFLSVLNELN